MKHSFFRIFTVSVLLLSLLLTTFAPTALGAKAETSEEKVTAVSVPSISSPFTTAYCDSAKDYFQS